MKCSGCSADNDSVIDSRPLMDNTMIRRRRRCNNCGHAWTTYEGVTIQPGSARSLHLRVTQAQQAMAKLTEAMEEIKNIHNADSYT